MEEEDIFESNLSCEELIEKLKTTPITHLHQLSTARFVDEDIIQIAPYIFTSELKYLDLTDSSINKPGGCVIAEELKKCKSLTYLNLRRNTVGIEATTAILDTLADYDIPIVTLNLRNNAGRSPISFAAYAKFISKCKTLRHLHIDSSPSMTPVFQVLKTNTSLVELHVELDGGIAHMVEDCFEENSTIIEGSGENVIRYITINQLCKQINASESERASIPRHLESRYDIEAFLKEVISNGEQWNAGKLIFLGNGEVGKTTLLKAIRAAQEAANKNKWFFQHKTKDFMATTRTIGIDQSILMLKDGEISVWDFGGQIEYAVTHQFFLSNEMVIILICYDLSQPSDVQFKQLSYWLDFLQSTLPPATSASARSKWKVIIVGTKLDLCDSTPQKDTLISVWQARWSRLPIHDRHFAVSSKSLLGVDKLLSTLEGSFTTIFNRHSVRIPKYFKALLRSLQTIPEHNAILPLATIFQQHAQGLSHERFTLALKYLHAIGCIVMLKGNLICVAPKMIPTIAAKFISPKEVRMKLYSSEHVEILDEQQVGTVLTISGDSNRLDEEIKVLEYIGVCFKLSGNTPAYLFPSLASKIPKLRFTIADVPSHLQLAATRFTAPPGSIFIPGFFCQFIVALLAKLNISKRELLAVHSNCISVRCGGLFVGELLVAIADDARSIISLIRASNPDLSIVGDVFDHLTSNHATQYQSSLHQTLCPTCVDLSYFQVQFPQEDIGIVIDEMQLPNPALFCKPRAHKVENSPAVLENLCSTHNVLTHDFYLSYCKRTEGKKSSSTSSEGKNGLAEKIYHKLATTKKSDEQPTYVFWDKKCSNTEQDWILNILNSMNSAKVILILVSRKAIEAIAHHAPTLTDATLLEYLSFELLYKNLTI